MLSGKTYQAWESLSQVGKKVYWDIPEFNFMSSGIKIDIYGPIFIGTCHHHFAMSYVCETNCLRPPSSGPHGLWTPKW